MPSRMQKDHDRKIHIPPEDKSEKFTFKPKTNEVITAKQFQEMQRKFEEKLHRKKSQMAVTIPHSPKFKETKIRPL